MQAVKTGLAAALLAATVLGTTGTAGTAGTATATQPAPSTPPAAGSRASAQLSWTVTLDQTQLQSKLGDRFSFVSTIRNETDRARPGTIAYLNVFSLTSDVYVDPEDWSSHRTRFLGEVKPGASVSVTWPVQAVNSGTFAVFVVVTSATGTDEIVTSPALRVDIADQRRLNPTGIVPVAVGVPTAAGLLLVWTRRRRRRLD